MVEPVSVIITTYDSGNGDRLNLCIKTLRSLLYNLSYENINWIIIDDSTIDVSNENASRIHDEFLDVGILSYTYLHNERAGIGVAKNYALEVAFEQSPYVLLLEDDWLLKQPLDLEPYVRILQEDTNVGMIRFGYLGSEHETLEARYRRGLPDMPWFTFWELKRGSDVYVYSGQVSLRHKRFYDTVGLHKKNDTPGEEELDMCKRYNATENAPVILWPAFMGAPLGTGIFDNIGLGYSTNNVEPGK